MDVGIRQLRADLAAMVRRAESGERIDITVGGRAIARLGPIGTTADPTAAADGIATLYVRGDLVRPRRADRRTAEGAVAIWRNVRLDRLLREVRG